MGGLPPLGLGSDRASVYKVVLSLLTSLMPFTLSRRTFAARRLGLGWP